MRSWALPACPSAVEAPSRTISAEGICKTAATPSARSLSLVAECAIEMRIWSFPVCILSGVHAFHMIDCVVSAEACSGFDHQGTCMPTCCLQGCSGSAKCCPAFFVFRYRLLSTAILLSLSVVHKFGCKTRIQSDIKHCPTSFGNFRQMRLR